MSNGSASSSDCAREASRWSHEVTPPVGIAAALRCWWHEPGDYLWLPNLFESFGSLAVLRAWIMSTGAVVCLGLGALQFAGVLASPAAQVATIALTASIFATVVGWSRPTIPAERLSIILVFATDVALVTAVLCCGVLLPAAVAGVLFVVPGAYLTLFHGPRVSVWHGIVTATTVLLHWCTKAEELTVGMVLQLAVTAAVSLVLVPAVHFSLWMVRKSCTDSLTDPLTNLANRRGLGVRVRQRRRDGAVGPTCVMVVDIDDFKRINDTYGHRVGDQVLVHCASVMCGAVRASAVVARTGGDEFVVVDRMPAGAAGPVGERIRALIAETVSPPVTVTIGVIVVETSIDTEVVEAALAAADGAMYGGKRRGGNRVAFSPAVPDVGSARS